MGQSSSNARPLSLAEGHLSVENATSRKLVVELRQTQVSVRYYGRVEPLRSNCNWSPSVHFDKGYYSLYVVDQDSLPSQYKEPYMVSETIKSIGFGVSSVLTFGLPYWMWLMYDGKPGWKAKDAGEGIRDVTTRIWIHGNSRIRVSEDEQGKLQLAEVDLYEEQEAHQLNGKTQVCPHNLPSVVFNAPGSPQSRSQARSLGDLLTECSEDDIKDSEIWEIVNHMDEVDSRLPHLATNLGLTTVQFDDIRYQYRVLSYQAFRVLKLWVGNTTAGAENRRVLVEILYRMNMRRLAQMLSNKTYAEHRSNSITVTSVA